MAPRRAENRPGSTRTPKATVSPRSAAPRSNKRKAAAAPPPSVASNGAGLFGAGVLELDSDQEASGSHRKGKGKERADEQADESDWSGDEEEGDFPELFLSGDEAAEDSPANGNAEGSGSDYEEDLDEEDDPDLDEDASGGLFDSSDEDAPPDVDSFLARATSKPDEADLTPGTTPDEGLNFMKKARMVPSKFVEGKQVREWDEIEPGYGSESSTEDAPNRVGNIPAHFYDDMPHIGYDIDGKKVMRPAKGDELDKFLQGVEDPTSWTSVEDKLLQQNVNLTEEELDIIKRLAKAENPDAAYDPYEDLTEFYTGKGKEFDMPINPRPEPKRRFVPSKWEHKKVMKIVRAIRQGRIVPSGDTSASKPKPQFYAIWSENDVPRAPGPMHMPAPKVKLPGHSESYNPPAEYLFTDEEKKEWESADPSDRQTDLMPQKYSSLRTVPGYGNFLRERFERLLDLYLAPRMLRRRPKLDISDPSELLPKLPSPRELRPFPTYCALEYVHAGAGRVRCLSIDPNGNWLATGADDGVVRVWELRVGRCAWSCKVGGGEDGPIHSLEWCPDKERSLIGVAAAGKVVVVSPLALLSPAAAAATLEYAHAGFSAPSAAPSTAAPESKWARASEAARDMGVLLEVSVPGSPKQLAWHRRGDYFATVSSEASTRAVLIHQLSTHTSQAPFRRLKGSVQKVAFHPHRPQFFVATQKLVRCYDLVRQELVKTMQPGLKWVSCLDVHPLGDNVIVGSYDKRLVWHDMDLSDRPYKTLRYHAKAIRAVSFHPTLPLFLSASDDGSIHVFHATVYSDLLMNPLLVPLKVLKGHEVKESLGVLGARWHPREAWCVSVGADGVAKLWVP